MNKKRLYLIIALIIVCLLAIGFFTYRYFNQKPKTIITNSPITETVDQSIELKNDEINFTKAQEDKDVNSCLLIKDSFSKNLCIQELAVTSKDITSCAIITDEEFRSNCSSSVSLEVAVASQKLDECQKITDSMLAKTCVERVTENSAKINCDLLSDQNLRNSCLSINYYQQAKSANDFKICNQIPELVKRANCLSEIKKIDLHSDADKDGLDFLQEIVSNTNPDNKDTDGDGHSDSEELVKGFNPDGAGTMAQIETINIMPCKDIKDEEIKALCTLELKGKPLDLFRCKDLNPGKLKDFCSKTVSSLIK
ncbi:MAG: thrombospondin type 3 repeat-containing protein [Patescibacteria group bacterium]